MKAEDFKPGESVSYIPMHAYGDINHPDVEHGVVSSQNGVFVFVKFWGRFNSQACSPEDLRREQ